MKIFYTSEARENLYDISKFIANESGNKELAISFIKRLKQKCKDLANKQFKLGISRPELGEGIRSYIFGNYIIFFRYFEAEALEIIMITEGHRDIDRLFDT